MKHTGGGAFNPQDSPIYFVAGHGAIYTKFVLQAVNDLWGPAGDRRLEEFLDSGHTMFLDSGIFWLTNRHKRAHGITMDEALALPPHAIDGFEELFARYLELVSRFGDRLWGYIELDQGGAIHKRQTRALLEDTHGLSPIPVYHPLNDGWEYFDELASQYDRICLGNIVQANRPTRRRLLHTLWERHRAYPNLWVHVLGLSPNEFCIPYQPDSCDSSSWLNPLRYPLVNTETAMLRNLGDLGEAWLYDMAQPSTADTGRWAAADMCKQGAAGLHSNWRAATTAMSSLLDQHRFPPYIDGETTPCPTTV